MCLVPYNPWCKNEVKQCNRNRSWVPTFSCHSNIVIHSIGSKSLHHDSQHNKQTWNRTNTVRGTPHSEKVVTLFNNAKHCSSWSQTLLWTHHWHPFHAGMLLLFLFVNKCWKSMCRVVSIAMVIQHHCYVEASENCGLIQKVAHYGSRWIFIVNGLNDECECWSKR
jgi:hypothetical protein